MQDLMASLGLGSSLSSLWASCYQELGKEVMGCVVVEFLQYPTPVLLRVYWGLFLCKLFYANNKGFIPRPRDPEVPEGEGEREEEEAWQKRQRVEAREEQVKQERKESTMMTQQRISYTTPFQSCQDMGSRLQKHWFWSWSVTTTAPLSRNCVPDLRNRHTLRQLNAVIREVKVQKIILLRQLNAVIREVKHPHLQPMLNLDYVQDSNHVVITQFGQGASLKDLIYQEADHTREPHAALPTSAAAAYGRQILLAANYLYRQGFPPLEHIQIGNIFVNSEGRNLLTLAQEMAARVGKREGLEGAGLAEGEVTDEGDHQQDSKVGMVKKEHKREGPRKDVGGVRVKDVYLHCCLGRLDKTLLGNSSDLLHKITEAGLKGRCDVIMFGHVMYELLSGHELEGVCLKEEELEKVHDETARGVLRRIFDLDAEPTMQEILSWDFFSKAKPSKLIRMLEEGGEEGVELTSDLQEFLRGMYKESGHSRAVTAGRGRNVVGKYLGKGYSWLTGHSRRKKT